MTRLTTLALAAISVCSLGACASNQAPTGGLTHAHHSIDYIEFTVLDLPAAKAFYGAAFGWSFQDYGPDYCGIRHPSGAEVGGMLLAEQVRSGGPLVVLFSTDIEASIQAVRAAGGGIVKELFEFPGGRRFHFMDPSGNELAVWAEPGE